ncbi:MAG: ribosome maturation factor RimM [Desulfovibrionaceae bacterium]
MDRAQEPGRRQAPRDEFVTVARVLRPHGVRGELAVACFAESPEVFDRTPALFLLPPGGRGRPRPLRVLAWREHGAAVLLRLEGLDDRDRAAELRGCELAMHARDLPEPEDDEVYLHDLLGLAVVLPGGEPVGTLARFLEVPGQEVWVIEHPSGREVLFPAAEELVAEIDLEAGRVVIDPPPGLLDLYLAEPEEKPHGPKAVRRPKAGPKSRPRPAPGPDSDPESDPESGPESAS